MTKTIENLFGERKDIVLTRHFLKSMKNIRGKLCEQVYSKIAKIGSGLAHEHYLEGNLKGMVAISVSKGGRVVYTQDPSTGNYIVNWYDPSHSYDC